VSCSLFHESLADRSHAAHSRTWQPRGPPWTFGASTTTWFAYSRSWTGRFDKSNVSELPQMEKAHASQLWGFNSEGDLHTNHTPLASRRQVTRPCNMGRIIERETSGHNPASSSGAV
jgi:hypothetical protein